jgi:tetratricopeptide (TPR) repeat protein
MMKEPAFGRVFSSDGSSRPTPRALAGLLFLLALLVAAALYWPGLNGAFILDDDENLQRLSELSSPLSASGLIDFLSSRLAGPLGRPVSMLTFALQYEAWPSDPRAFKLVNLLIHLLNGVLVYGVLVAIQRVSRPAAFASPWIALAGAALWLVHPIHVSTVLYAVQRMTELSATFMLLGVLGYLVGRQHAALGRDAKALGWMSLAVAFGIVLASLSKENGVMLPLYLIVLEFTLLREVARPRWWRAWSGTFLWLPVAALGVYLATQLPQYQAVYAQRDFGMAERLLTQARVLTDYLFKIVLPRPAAFGLFFDDFAVSRGWLSPPTTLPAVAFVGALLAGAVVLRRRAPVLAFGLLWFFAGHVLESTFLPLELYYEHRNYLPALGILFAGAFYAGRLLARLGTSPLGQPAIVALAVLGLAYPAVTWTQTDLWGHPMRQAVVWAAERPDSPRAVERAGAMMAIGGRTPEALRYFVQLAERFPDQAIGHYQWLLLACVDQAVPRPPWDALVARSREARMSYGVLGTLDALLGLREQGRCGHVPQRMVTEAIEALQMGGNYATRSARLRVAHARSLQLEGRTNEALAALEKAYAELPRPEIALLQARWLLESGRADEAVRLLDGPLAPDRLAALASPALAAEIAELRRRAVSTR